MTVVGAWFGSVGASSELEPCAPLEAKDVDPGAAAAGAVVEPGAAAAGAAHARRLRRTAAMATRRLGTRRGYRRDPVGETPGRACLTRPGSPTSVLAVAALARVVSLLRLTTAASAAAALAVLLLPGAALALPSGSLVQQGKKIVPGDEFIAEPAKGSEFGTSVAISADGNTVIVGGVGDEVLGSMGGAAWVFTRSGGVWSEQQKLLPEDSRGEPQFGISVALSADGNTALIGGIGDQNVAEEPVGAAWVFTRSGSKWVQQGPKLAAGKKEAIGGRFGKSVALSADGNTALIGAYFDKGLKGSAWVFARSGSTWKSQGPELEGAGEAGEGQFGISAALSADGNTALIGGPFDNKEKGAVWAFTRSGSTWSPQGPKVTASDEVEDAQLGASVALSGEGNTALVGGPGEGGGAAWAFTRAGSTWTQQGAKLTPSDESGTGGFGAGVALSADGNTAVIGAPADEVKLAQPTGAVWEFARSGSTWSQQGLKTRGSEIAKEAEFGVAPTLSADGDTAFIGGPIDEDVIGAGWAFADPPPEATTGAASGVGISAATATGTVGAGASNRSYFQLGTTTAYGAATAAQELGRSAGPRTLSAALSGLSAATTYHYRLVVENSAGQSFGADQAFTTSASAVVCLKCGLCLGKCASGLSRPFITAVSQSHTQWREGSRTATFSRTRVPVGTTFKFTLDEAAAMSFAFTQRVPGRKVHGRCVAQTKANRRAHVCKRTLVRGALAAPGHKGHNRLLFQGVLARGKRLRPGTYTLVFKATAHGAVSAPVSLTFTIVK